MWFLNFLPSEFLESVINGILYIGIFSVFFSFFIINKISKLFPLLSTYNLLIQILSVIILISGVYLKGSYSTEKTWRERVKIVEEKLKAAEAESNKVNIIIEEQIVYRDKIIKEKGETQVQYIDRVIKEKEEIIKYVENCPIPKDILIEHNLATKQDSTEKIK